MSAIQSLANIDMLGSNKVINVPTPSADGDAAPKSYVDSVAQGLDAKASVRVATTANITIATALNAGDVIDGVTLAAPDRVLVKDQTTKQENGIYVVSGSPARASDADAAGELSGGSYTFVEEGTANADTGWVIITDGVIVPGATAHDWTQFTGAGTVVAGAGLTKSGSTLNVGDGSGITVNADDIAVNVGTGLEVSSDAVRIAAAAAGAGLTGGAGSALAVGDGAGITVNADDVAVNAGAGLEISSDALRIAAAAAGSGLSGGAGSALDVELVGTRDNTGVDGLDFDAAGAGGKLGVDPAIVPRKAVANTFTQPQTIDLGASGTVLTGDVHVNGEKYFSMTEGGVERGYLAERVNGIELNSPTGEVYIATGGNAHIQLNPGGTGYVSVNSSIINSVTDPVAAQDAATKAYVDSMAGLSYETNVGDGSTTAIAVNHGLTSRDVQVEVYRNASPWDTIIVPVERTSTGTVTLQFNSAPSAAAYRCLVKSQ